MKLKQKTLAIIIVSTTLALLGLIWLQVILLQKAQVLEMQAFRQNVKSTMSRIVQQIEKQEAITAFFAVTRTDTIENSRFVHVQQGGQGHTAVVDSIFKIMNYRTRQTGGKIKFDFETDSLNRRRGFGLVLVDSSLTYADSIVGEGTFSFKFNLPSKGISSRLDQKKNKLPMPSRQPDSLHKKKLITRVLSEIGYGAARSFEERIGTEKLAAIIESAMREAGINTSFVFGVYHSTKDRFSVMPAGISAATLVNSEFKTLLFPFDIQSAGEQLILHFPDQKGYLFKEIRAPLAATVLLISVVIICFSFTLRTIFKQKRFAASLRDFINNMIHEFKTPISTISLASEAMVNPSVIKDVSKLRQYSGIIGAENGRLREQVEKILQIAVLEEGDYELDIATVDVHSVLEAAVQNMSLYKEKLGGTIRTRAHAESSIITADAVHFSNIIQNLLDNALKYTRGQPHITIATENVADGVSISISDNGIGMHTEEKKRIFEKYYRVSTGNVHDVKGFGLGLSYVKLMVEAHGGSIVCESEFGRGSTFRLLMPFMCAQEKLKNGKTKNSTD